MRYRNPLRAATGGIFLIGLAIAFALSGHWFLPILFITLACTSFLGASNFNRQGVYSGSYGFVWLLMLALFFLTGSWLWFLVGAGLSVILGSLWRPMIRGAFSNRQTYYQPTYQQPPTYQPYEQGYQPPAQQPASYQEGGQQHPFPQQAQEPQDEQPQVQYPQEMPPPQQG